MKPPRLAELLDDPQYRAYMLVIPRLAANLRHGQPWAVWARKTTGSWMGGMFADYRDAWTVTLKYMRHPSIEDVAIVSRRQMFNPPAGLMIALWDYEWCGRCRRPTSYATRPHHHALRTSPAVTTDDDSRCYYCGMRRVAQPTYR